MNQTFHNYVIAQGLSPMSAIAYQNCVENYQRATGLNGNATAESVSQFIANHKHPNTRRAYYYAMKRYGGYLNQPLVSDIKPPKLEKTLPKPLSKANLTLLLKAPNSPAKALFVFLTATGVRVSEALGITKADFIASTGSLTVMGKGGKERVVFIDKKARVALSEYAGGHNSHWLFSIAGNQMTREEAYNLLRAWGRGFGVKLTPHICRHTFATYMLLNGLNIRTLQKILGHASLNTTAGYLDVTTGLMESQYKKASFMH